MFDLAFLAHPGEALTFFVDLVGGWGFVDLGGFEEDPEPPGAQPAAGDEDDERAERDDDPDDRQDGRQRVLTHEIYGARKRPMIASSTRMPSSTTTNHPSSSVIRS